MTKVEIEKQQAFQDMEAKETRFREFFNARSADLEPFAEAVYASSNNKVYISVHPFFQENERIQSDSATKQYNTVRQLYIFRAAQAGKPVLIFEEDRVINTPDQFDSRYGEIVALPNVMFVRTIQEDPTPYNQISQDLSDMSDRVHRQFPYYKPWNEEEVAKLSAVVGKLGLTVPPIPTGERLSLDLSKQLRRIHLRADLLQSNRVFGQLGQQLREVKTGRISLGGTKYEQIVKDTEIQRGCVSFTATELHRLGFRVNISNYFVYPDKPTAEIQSVFRNSKPF